MKQRMMEFAVGACLILAAGFQILPKIAPHKEPDRPQTKPVDFKPVVAVPPVRLAVFEEPAAPEAKSEPIIFTAAPAKGDAVADMTDAELQDALDCAKQDVAAIEAELNRRHPPKAVKASPTVTSTPTATATGCDCQCQTTGVCTCPGGGMTAANFTSSPQVMMVTEDQPVYTDVMEPRRGLFGVPRPFLLGYGTTRVQTGVQRVSYPASVQSTTYGTPFVTSSRIVSSSPTVSYQSSPARVSTVVTTPSVQSSNVIYSAPRASGCVQLSNGQWVCPSR